MSTRCDECRDDVPTIGDVAQGTGGPPFKISRRRPCKACNVLVCGRCWREKHARCGKPAEPAPVTWVQLDASDVELLEALRLQLVHRGPIEVGPGVCVDGTSTLGQIAAAAVHLIAASVPPGRE